MSAPQLVEHFFRHEYGRLVATLSRRVGVQHIETIEDAVQSALMTAIESWTAAGLPDNPSAWLVRVAHNELFGELRQRTRRRCILEQNATEGIGIPDHSLEPLRAGEVQADLLRMLFICCDDAIPVESQLVFALKTLCGFDIRELAHRLFTSEANVYKRLGRARRRLRELPLRTDELTAEQCSARLPAVHKILYLLFTEGYLSSHAETAIRRELCNEAIRLAAILAEHPVGRTPETSALLALMHLHAARMTARQDGSGGLLLLEEQDRSLWDRQEIQVGLEWLAKSARGDVFSRYHAEAGIAAQHCLASSFEETRWDTVAECYSLLEQIAPSAIHRLNRAVAVAEWQGPAAGLVVLDGFVPPTWLAGSYQWAAVLADLHQRCGNARTANGYRTIACNAAPTPAIKELLQRRLRNGASRPTTVLKVTGDQRFVRGRVSYGAPVILVAVFAHATEDGMAYDEGLAQRIREMLGTARVTEKKMFGGLAFLSRGHMLVGIVGDTLMARIGSEPYAEALRKPHVREMDFTGRSMKGYVFVDPPGIERDDDLERWIVASRAFVRSLPGK